VLFSKRKKSLAMLGARGISNKYSLHNTPRFPYEKHNQDDQFESHRIGHYHRHWLCFSSLSERWRILTFCSNYRWNVCTTFYNKSNISYFSIACILAADNLSLCISLPLSSSFYRVDYHRWKSHRSSCRRDGQTTCLLVVVCLR
jgi:hypothetical protein